MTTKSFPMEEYHTLHVTNTYVLYSSHNINLLLSELECDENRGLNITIRDCDEPLNTIHAILTPPISESLALLNEFRPLIGKDMLMKSNIVMSQNRVRFPLSLLSASNTHIPDMRVIEIKTNTPITLYVRNYKPLGNRTHIHYSHIVCHALSVKFSDEGVAYMSHSPYYGLYYYKLSLKSKITPELNDVVYYSKTHREMPRGKVFGHKHISRNVLYMKSNSLL